MTTHNDDLKTRIAEVREIMAGDVEYHAARRVHQDSLQDLQQYTLMTQALAVFDDLSNLLTPSDEQGKKALEIVERYINLVRSWKPKPPEIHVVGVDYLDLQTIRTAILGLVAENEKLKQLQPMCECRDNTWYCNNCMKKFTSEI